MDRDEGALAAANEIVSAEMIKLAHRRVEWARLRDALLDDSLIAAVAGSLQQQFGGDAEEMDAIVLLAVSDAIDRLGLAPPDWFMAN